MAITSTVVDTSLLTGSTGTTSTITGATFGTAFSDRVIVVAINMDGSEGITALTIGGVSAELFGQTGGTYVGSAVVPTGTTGNIVATLTGTDAIHVIGILSLSGAANATQFDAANNATFATDNITITVPASGSAVISGVTASGGTWTNATAAATDTSLGFVMTSAYFDNAGGSTSRTFTLNGGGFFVLTGASFSPLTDVLAAQIWI